MKDLTPDFVPDPSFCAGHLGIGPEHDAGVMGSGLSLSYIDLQSNHGKAFTTRIRTCALSRHLSR